MRAGAKFEIILLAMQRYKTMTSTYIARYRLYQGFPSRCKKLTRQSRQYRAMKISRYFCCRQVRASEYISLLSPHAAHDATMTFLLPALAIDGRARRDICHRFIYYFCYYATAGAAGCRPLLGQQARCHDMRAPPLPPTTPPRPAATTAAQIADSPIFSRFTARWP